MTGEVFVGSEGEDLAWRMMIQPTQRWTTVTHANLDDDPLDEIIAGSSDALWAFDDGKHMVETLDGPKPEVLWRTPVGWVDRAEVTDLDGDGNLEVVVFAVRNPGTTACTGGGNREILVYDAHTGDPITGYLGPPFAGVPYSVDSRLEGRKDGGWAIEDINGDGVKDISMTVFIGGTDTQYFDGAFAIDGATLLANPVPGGLVSVGEEALLWMVDDDIVSGSGQPRENIVVVPTPKQDHDLVVFNGNGATFAVNGATGEIVWGDLDLWPEQLQMGDVDGDGRLELVKIGRAIEVFDAVTGDLEHSHSYDAFAGDPRPGLTLADVDRDGVLDIIGIFETITDSGHFEDDLVVAVNATTGAAFWSVNLGPETENDLTSAVPHVFDVTGDGFPEIVVGQNEGWWHPEIDNNNNDPPRILVIDAQRGVVLWEQVFFDKTRFEVTVANHDGSPPYEIFNVGHFFLTAWEPTLEDQGTSAPPEDPSDGLGYTAWFCT